jgi:hypothetical protein
VFKEIKYIIFQQLLKEEKIFAIFSLAISLLVYFSSLFAAAVVLIQKKQNQKALSFFWTKNVILLN